MSISTEHHGNEVSYDERDDIWYSRDMGLKAKTLSLLKKKMDKVLSVERRMDNLPVLITDEYGRGKIVPGFATLFDAREGYGVLLAIDEDKGWIKWDNGGRGTRDLSDLRRAS